MCRFYRDFLPWETLATIAGQLNEAPVSVEELRALANDVTDRIRVLNTKCGAVPADDTVAERFFREATDKAPALDREELARRVRIYWLKRGWTEDGYVRDAP
jgi:aldehyde:ferredoxin oxidoreductase